MQLGKNKCSFTGHEGKISLTFRCIGTVVPICLLKPLLRNAQFHFKKSDDYTSYQGGVQRGFIVPAKHHFSILGCSAGICSV